MHYRVRCLLDFDLKIRSGQVQCGYTAHSLCPSLRSWGCITYITNLNCFEPIFLKREPPFQFYHTTKKDSSSSFWARAATFGPEEVVIWPKTSLTMLGVNLGPNRGSNRGFFFQPRLHFSFLILVLRMFNQWLEC